LAVCSDFIDIPPPPQPYCDDIPPLPEEYKDTCCPYPGGHRFQLFPCNKTTHNPSTMHTHTYVFVFFLIIFLMHFQRPSTDAPPAMHLCTRLCSEFPASPTPAKPILYMPLVTFHSLSVLREGEGLEISENENKVNDGVTINFVNGPEQQEEKRQFV
jgi:hypothetical protein